MDISVAHPRELEGPDLQRWREVQGANPLTSNPFLAPAFAISVGQARDSARVAVINDGGAIGFLAFERRSRHLATAIGYGLSDCQGLIAQPELAVTARALIGACGMPGWEFDHLVEGQPILAPHVRTRHRSPVLDLRAGYDAYALERLGANSALKGLAEKRRRLERQVGPVRLEYEVVDESAFEQLMAWKSAQYRRTRVMDRFSVPWMTETVRRLYASHDPDCSGLLSALYAGDHRIAMHFGLRSRTVVSYWFPAYDPEYGRFSPGLQLLLAMAQHAASEDGIDQIDLGRGWADYKDRLANAAVMVGEGRVPVDHSTTAVRAAHRTYRSAVAAVRRRRPLRHVRWAAQHVRRVLT